VILKYYFFFESSIESAPTSTEKQARNTSERSLKFARMATIPVERGRQQWWDETDGLSPLLGIERMTRKLVNAMNDFGGRRGGIRKRRLGPNQPLNFALENLSHLLFTILDWPILKICLRFPRVARAALELISFKMHAAPSGSLATKLKAAILLK